jgi:hypothetical protein
MTLPSPPTEVRQARRRPRRAPLSQFEPDASHQLDAIEDSMGYCRVGSRLPEADLAGIVLEALAHDVSRLVTARRLHAVHLVVGPSRATVRGSGRLTGAEPLVLVLP